MGSSIDLLLATARHGVDARWAHWAARLDWHPDMRDAATYVLSGGGKAVRPAIVAWVCAQLTGESSRVSDNTLDLGLALECVHAYSLVHDDLPCMDDDDFRRGRPTLHRLKGEAHAVLAGDALLTGAFEILALSGLDPAAKARAVRELSRAAGGAGMVGGQVYDLAYKSTAFGLDDLVRNHDLKTGALFGAAAAFGSLAASPFDPPAARHDAARKWGVKLGLLFQVVDDILDAGPGADAKGDEGPNFVNLMGLEDTRRYAARIREELSQEGQVIGFERDALAALLDFFVDRKF